MAHLAPAAWRGGHLLSDSYRKIQSLLSKVTPHDGLESFLQNFKRMVDELWLTEGHCGLTKEFYHWTYDPQALTWPELHCLQQIAHRWLQPKQSSAWLMKLWAWPSPNLNHPDLWHSRGYSLVPTVVRGVFQPPPPGLCHWSVPADGQLYGPLRVTCVHSDHREVPAAHIMVDNWWKRHCITAGPMPTLPFPFLIEIERYREKLQ